MNDKSQVEAILNDIKTIVENVIIKSQYEAEKHETLHSKREAEKYVTAYLERDGFNSYRSFPMNVLAKAGISNLNDLANFSEDKNRIPHDKRKAVVKAMRETVVKEYIEMNDYYRNLIGLPPINTPEEEYIYLTEEEMAYYGIDEVRPIHDYPKEIQYKLERHILPQLIELYPEKSYLQHMGSKSVNLVRARQARNFEIIYTDVILDTVFLRAFFDTYDFSREYFMNMIYNKAFKERYNLYDNYIGMHIMIMTIQRLIVDTIKMGIDRDFYDIVSIQKLFNVYGIPFFEDLPLDYQRTIVKNVNMLIRAKSTDKVLYDIANTLFYERVKIYKYSLVKQRKFDENGEPIYAYKEQILDAEPENYYLKSSNNKTYALAISNDKLMTLEADVEYAPESIYTKDAVTGETIRIFMIDDNLYSENVTTEGHIITDVMLYNEYNIKYKLGSDKNSLSTDLIPYNTVTVYDYEQMYDVYFQATDIMEKNTISSLETKYNRYSYDEITNDDVYWWETEELKRELYEREYSFIDTKYISITVMQNVTKMLYETVYYLNLLVDNKDTTVPLEQRIYNSDSMKIGTDYLYINLDRISSVPVSIFDTVMIACALISKKNGMKGNIIVESPSKILSVLGFNFEANFDLIRNNIKKYKRVFKNQEILNYLDLLDIKTVKDIDILFNNFKNFSEFCADMIANTTDINEYKAYKELYKVITVREDSTSLFTKTDGTLATTYLDYLYDKVPVIAKFVDEMHKDKTGIYIEHIIGKLNELVPEIEYLNTINGTNNYIVQAIHGLVNFFKSYTVDLRTLNILYIFDNKTLNKIYMIDDPRVFSMLYGNEFCGRYSDEMRPLVSFDKHDNLVIYDPEKTKVQLNPKEFVNEYDKLVEILNMINLNELLELNYTDTIEAISSFTKNDIIDLRDFYNYESRLYFKDKFIDLTHVVMLKLILGLVDNIELDYKDLIKNVTNDIFIIDQIKIKIKNNIDNILYKNDKYNLKAKAFLSIIIDVIDVMELDYKDIIKETYVDLTFLDFTKIKIKNVIDNILYKSENHAIFDSYSTQLCVEINDSLKFIYNDIIRQIINTLNPNSRIHLGDNVKIIYED